MQGDQAAESIVKGIQALDRAGVDTIIIGRGGGSLEDLWAFNEEIVAQAVFECTTPIISAVGHETDTVITDYVADLRAPTPSAGAELAVFDYGQFRADLNAYYNAFNQTMQRRLDICRERTESCRRQLIYLSPASRIRQQRLSLQGMSERLRSLMDRRMAESRHKLELSAARLESLSPLKRLTGGYGYVTDMEGKPVTGVSGRQENELLRIRLRDGALETRITQVFTDQPGEEKETD